MDRGALLVLLAGASDHSHRQWLLWHELLSVELVPQDLRFNLPDSVSRVGRDVIQAALCDLNRQIRKPTLLYNLEPSHSGNEGKTPHYLPQWAYFRRRTAQSQRRAFAPDGKRCDLEKLEIGVKAKSECQTSRDTSSDLSPAVVLRFTVI